MTPRFTIGQVVRMPAFVDCFGKAIPERADLRVTRVELIEHGRGDTLRSYYRVSTVGVESSSYEGAERFFEPQHAAEGGE